MSTLQINLSESLQQFVAKQVVELGLDRPDQYFEQLLEEERQKQFDDYCMLKVQEAIDQNEWIPEDEFWRRVNQDTQTRRNACETEAV
jgi:hypothetical protein